MKERIKKLIHAAKRKKKVLVVCFSCVLIAGALSLCWYYSGEIIPHVQAGEGTAINPEFKNLKEIKNPDPHESGPKEEVLTYDEIKQEKYAKNAIRIATQEGLQRVPGAPKVQSKTVYSYSPAAIYEIFCHEAYLTDIQLQPGEDIQFIGGGDTVRWIVDRALSGSGDEKRWHIYVRPLKAGLMTNIMIATDRRSYQLKVRSTADFYSPIVGWTYPLEEKAAFIRMKEDEEPISNSANVTPDRMNFKYSIKEQKGWFDGSYSWTPTMVFDDGRKTYIKMGENMPSGEAPALFVKGKSGLALVNYRVKKNFYIVDRLFKQAELKNGEDETVVITQN